MDKKSRKVRLANSERLERRQIHSPSVEGNFNSWSISVNEGGYKDQGRKLPGLEKA